MIIIRDSKEFVINLNHSAKSGCLLTLPLVENNPCSTINVVFHPVLWSTLGCKCAVQNVLDYHIRTSWSECCHSVWGSYIFWQFFIMICSWIPNLIPRDAFNIHVFRKVWHWAFQGWTWVRIPGCIDGCVDQYTRKLEVFKLIIFNAENVKVVLFNEKALSLLSWLMKVFGYDNGLCDHSIRNLP